MFLLRLLPRLLLVLAMYALPSHAKDMQPKGSRGRYLRKSSVGSGPKIQKGVQGSDGGGFGLGSERDGVVGGGSERGNDGGSPPVDSPKSVWPEVVGMMGEQAKIIIEDEAEGVNGIIVPDDAYVSMDYRTDRVWIRVNTDGIVTVTPMIG